MRPIAQPIAAGSRATFSIARNPIITVTEHTPSPSPDYLRRQGSIDSQLDAFSIGAAAATSASGMGAFAAAAAAAAASAGGSNATGGTAAGFGGIGSFGGLIFGGVSGCGGGATAASFGGCAGAATATSGNGNSGSSSGGGGGGGSGGARAAQMLRSHTDSHIDYSVMDEPEAPGSGIYITRDGAIDLEVVMLAVYQVFKRDQSVCSLRVLETGLNVCDLLIELGVMRLRVLVEDEAAAAVAAAAAAAAQPKLAAQQREPAHSKYYHRGKHAGGTGATATAASATGGKLCVNALNLALGIARRTLLHLGCPHGCNEGEFDLRIFVYTLPN